jgi:hypothetical protein
VVVVDSERTVEVEVLRVVRGAVEATVVMVLDAEETPVLVTFPSWLSVVELDVWNEVVVLGDSGATAEVDEFDSRTWLLSAVTDVVCRVVDGIGLVRSCVANDLVLVTSESEVEDEIAATWRFVLPLPEEDDAGANVG